MSGTGSSPRSLMEQALERRRSLLEDPALDAFRLFHGAADGIEGLVIERFGDVLIVQLHEERLRLPEPQVRRLAETVHERLGTRAVYRKFFIRERARLSPELDAGHHDPTPWIGTPVEPEQVVREHGLRFIIRPYDGFSVGLFLEHRENRRRVRELCGTASGPQGPSAADQTRSGPRVLNLFCYTCGFSVAAAAGGAAATASVDLHRRYLEWGKRNFEINGIRVTQPQGITQDRSLEMRSPLHLFFLSDIFDFYKRAVRQGRVFDLIILDPPTFSRTRRPASTFVLADQLDPLCAGAVQLLSPGGRILLATNDRRIPPARLEEALNAAARADSSRPRDFSIIERPGLPDDFAGDPDYARCVIARFG